MTVQVPAPAPDPNLILINLLPIFGMLTGVVIVGMIALGPVGRAIGEVIRHWLGGERSRGPALEELDELRNAVEGMRSQLAELAERQDFTERIVTQVRAERALPGGPDAAG
jgi:hypothetical protein